ncbi:neuronal acetylcholine receptor subunit alpha-10-like isoform X1 [Babylonia areolata]|uniref:neuronal acetylcholine receptor subunit alpha-10-like isoform X1 n=1 Tax=Babylonia areolata TaxID=304850 RepID=UPI003FD3D02D
MGNLQAAVSLCITLCCLWGWDRPLVDGGTPTSSNSNRSTTSGGRTLSREKQLIRDLIQNYEQQGRNGRPVADHTHSLLVNFSLSLIQIMDVDEQNQVLKTNVWYHYKWVDQLLQWTPAKHDHITSVRVPSTKIWLPDILLYNFADDRLKERRDALVVVQHTGEVLWMPQAMLNSSCSFNTLYFPFDKQTCQLKFGSWTYNGLKLDVDFIDGQGAMDVSDFTPNNEWTIVSNEGIKNVQYYSCCPEPYPDITFTLTIRRRVAFYTFILILPCALLSLLTMVIFWVPPESPAKLQIGMNIFLAFFVLLLLLADYTPRAAASIPLIGAYFCLSMIMITLSTVMACIVANMFFRGVRTSRAPRWLRSCVIDGLARVLCMRQSFLEPRNDVTTPKKTWSTFVSTYRSFSDPETLCAKVHLLEVDDNPDSKAELDDDDCAGLQDLFAEASGAGVGEEEGEEEDWEEEAAHLVTEVGSIREMMTLLEERRDSSEAKMRHIKEWRIIAVVLDRLFFLVYIAINLLGLAAIFVRVLLPD